MTDRFQQGSIENTPVEGSPVSETDQRPESKSTKNGEASKASGESGENLEHLRPLLWVYNSVPPSRRSEIGGRRALWQTYRQLANCSPLKLCEHLKTNLKSLRLNKKSRLEFLQSIGAVPKEEAFWQTLQKVWETSCNRASSTYRTEITPCQCP